MKRILFLLAVLCLLLTPALAEEGVTAPFAPEGVLIDGEMDAIWKTAVPVPMGKLFAMEVVPGFY